MDSEAAGSSEIERAWHLLTVVIRLGRPAAASDVARFATAADVERLCRIPGSPLRLSGGVVAASETAFVAFLRFVGLDVPPPRVSLRAPDDVMRWLRRRVPVTYGRKRKASDAGRFVARKRLLAAPDADLPEHELRQSQQLIVQSCAPVATGEVHQEATQELQDRLPSINIFTAQRSFEVSIGSNVFSDIEISMPSLPSKIDQFIGGNDGSVLVSMASALVPKEVTDMSGCINIFHATVDRESSRTGEPEGSAPLCCSRVEDREELEKESTLLTMAVGLAVGKKNGIEQDLNLRPSSPSNCSTKATDDMETIDVISKEAEALQYYSPNAQYPQKILTCGQDSDALVVNAHVAIHENKIEDITFQPPEGTKTEAIVHEMVHETMGSLCQPSPNTKVEHAVLPLQAPTYGCISNENLNIAAENRASTHQNHMEPSTQNEVAVRLSKKEQDRKIMKQRDKGKKKEALPKEDKDQVAAKVQKGHTEPKPLPNFKNFEIEEEEGSGGYGTVYRARRKSDGRLFAIKCPHANAHSHHVYNEQKMLERFGGKNFVIKYECSLRSGDLECFVLEHVEHDRPENLRKEIGLFDLRWYGFCLFKALASLHKQGIVHRDVKPGNFLFSRKLAKGYLIDFNLANDLHQKFFRNSKSETISRGKDTISQSALKSTPVVQAKEPVADSKQLLGSKRKRSNRSPVGSAPKNDNKSRHGIQAADVSGVTSAKDPTSTKTSLDRLKQPMPYKGRKELMNFLHDAMQSPDKNTSTAPVSQRKRVAAPLGNVDHKLFILTPMPLCSGGSAIAGSGMLNSKGNGKHRREGPCVGTKGFRAPEVLFRSFHQGCKVDVWSAGVTLLYFIIGKSPFGGDPEQNIKEIAKLKGSEELWEVAKLHNCESSYPSDLFDAKSLRSVDLREWCAANTRRPEFFKSIPDSLFDLVDNCLSVNPRCRITSEDALMHDFFAPCHDLIRQHRLARRPAPSNNLPCLPQDKLVKANESKRSSSSVPTTANSVS
uniref:non-specific serine/threonine protein kinase n=1 Tax=Oryza meridionalis TaxID=40149 RepID=A0A0E0EGN0_9ORYZ